MNKILTDKNFIDWESEYFGYGYGDGETYVIKALRDFFNNMNFRNENDYDIYTYKTKELEKCINPTVLWLLINILCKVDIIEYGTSPRNGWLTERGICLYQYFKTKTDDELYDILTDVDESFDRCSSTYCCCNGGERNKPCFNNPLFN